MKSDCSPKDTHIETKGCSWDFDCKTKKWNSLKNFNQNIMRERKRTGKALFLLAQKDTQNKHRDRGNEELILFFDKKRAYTYTFCVCVYTYIYLVRAEIPPLVPEVVGITPTNNNRSTAENTQAHFLDTAIVNFSLSFSLCRKIWWCREIVKKKSWERERRTKCRVGV